jgi:thiol-disulfide isomerase/thioredoxin
VKNSRWILWVTILVIVAGIFIAIRYANTGNVQKSATQAPTVGTAQQGQKAPEFQAATDHGYFDLAKTDKPVFLEVFATWCPHCQRETTIIDRLYAKYKNQVDFVAVTGSNVGMDHQSPESEQDTLNFIHQFHTQYPVAFDGSMSVANAYLQGGYPTLVVIDKNKTVSYLSSGETSFGELDSAIKKALAS